VTFMEALNSGKPMRREGWRQWWEYDQGWFSGSSVFAMREGNWPRFIAEDYNATDWEIAP
jgi:hypothetical protein